MCIHHRRAAAAGGEAAQSAAAREEDSSSWCLSSRSSSSRSSSSSGGQTTVLPVNKDAFLHVQHLRFAILDHVLSFIRSGTYHSQIDYGLGDILPQKTKCPKTKYPKDILPQDILPQITQNFGRGTYCINSRIMVDILPQLFFAYFFGISQAYFGHISGIS